MKDDTARRQDLLGAGLAVLLGLFALIGTRGMSELGSVFPTTAAIVLLLGGIGLGLRALLAHREPMDQLQIAWGRVLGLALILVLWALLLTSLGFIASSALGMIGIAVVTYRERQSMKSIAFHLIAGAMLIALFYFLFGQVLRVPLP